MKVIARWLIWIPFGLVIAAFLIANRQPVAISLDPISTETPAFQTFALPLWFWLSLSLMTGFFIGAVGMWNSARPKRAMAKADSRELKALKKQLAAETEKAATATKSSDLPTLKAS